MGLESNQHVRTMNTTSYQAAHPELYGIWTHLSAVKGQRPYLLDEQSKGSTLWVDI